MELVNQLPQVLQSDLLHPIIQAFIYELPAVVWYIMVPLEFFLGLIIPFFLTPTEDIKVSLSYLAQMATPIISFVNENFGN